MKKLILILSLWGTFSQLSFSQAKMLVDQQPGLTYLDGHGKLITSFKKIPKNIRDSATAVLSKYLGNFSLKVKFHYGQIVDLDAYNKSKGGATVNSLIPKYDLVFILTDMSIGIKRFPIELRLNNVGKPLKLNWPRAGYTVISKFLPLDSVRNAALSHAKKLDFNFDGYTVSF